MSTGFLTLLMAMNGHPRSLYVNSYEKIMTSTSQDLFQVLTINKDWHNLLFQIVTIIVTPLRTAFIAWTTFKIDFGR